MKTTDEAAPPALVSSADDLPLLPRVTAKEVWESGNKPLPPLPVKKKPVAVVREASSDDTSLVENEPGETPSLEQPDLPEPEPSPVELVAAPAEPEPQPVNIPPLEVVTAPTTKVIPWGEGETTIETPDTQLPTRKQVTPESFDQLLQAHRGRILLLNTWGVDCAPCVAELPYLEIIHQTFKAKGLNVVAVNSDVQRRWNEVEQFIKAKELTFEVWLKAPGSDTRFRQMIDPEYGADPFTAIYDRSGKKIYTIADALTLEEWNQVALALCEGKPIPITKPDVIRSLQ